MDHGSSARQMKPTPDTDDGILLERPRGRVPPTVQFIRESVEQRGMLGAKCPAGRAHSA